MHLLLLWLSLLGAHVSFKIGPLKYVLDLELQRDILLSRAVFQVVWGGLHDDFFLFVLALLFDLFFVGSDGI